MSLRLRLSLLPLLIAGCAGELMVVPDSDWQGVPATQRDAVDRQLVADLAAARAEQAAATTDLATLKHAQPTLVAPPRAAPATSPGPAGSGDEWTTDLHAQEQVRIAASAQVETAKAAWQRADVTWRQLRLDAATARIAVVVAQRELVRARTIDRNLPGSDTYDVAPLRGQFSQAQQRWYRISSNARQARAALEQASTTLTAAKEAYAYVMRNGELPPPAPTSIASDDRPPPLQLTGGGIVRSDVHRRRGLRHFLGAPPQLRRGAIQLHTRRSAQAISLGMTPMPAAAPTDGNPAVEAPPGAAPPRAEVPAGQPVSQANAAKR
jgi:hypothetical protein